MAERWHISPFEVYSQDCDYFIDMVNYLLRTGKEETPKRKGNDKQKRIKVNDKTATGGWF